MPNRWAPLRRPRRTDKERCYVDDLDDLSRRARFVAYGLVAGVFLTFSDFVMRSLGAVTPASGIAAIQSINRRVY